MKVAEKLAAVETELAKVQKEYDGLSQALGDPTLTAWVADRGRAAPRKLSAFEIATVKRIASLEPKLDKLEDQREDLFAETICEIAGIPSDSDVGDPEVLLRAALVCLNRMHKTGMSTPESRAVMEALLGYLKSLTMDEDDE